MPVLVDRLESGDANIPAAQVLSGALATQFTPQPYAAITPARDHDEWYRLRFVKDWSAQRRPMLSIADPQGLEVEAYVPPAYTGTTFSIYGARPEFGFSRHALAIALPIDLKSDVPIYLRIKPARALPHEMQI